MTGPGADGSGQPVGAVVEDEASGPLSCPSCASPVAAGRAVLRGLRCRPGPAGTGRRRRSHRRSPRRHGRAVSAVVTSGRRLLHEVRGECVRARATTSPSSRPRGWQPCATAVFGTRATRTPSPWTPGPSRAATRCSSCVTGSRRRRTPTWPASRRPAPPATSWPSPAPRGWARPPRASRRAPGPSSRRRTRPTQAVIAHTTSGPGNPASCTFVAAVVDGPLLVVGWVGDSRAYWLPDAGDAQLLTVDDSFAAEQIAHGVPRAVAESGPQAHAITRWLGIDAPDHTPRTVSLDLDGPGWVMVCSDGLWNYCSEPRDLAALVSTTGRTSGPSPSDWPGPSSTGPTPRGARTTSRWHSPAWARPGRWPRHSSTQPTAASAPQPTAHREEVQPDGNVLS